MDVPQLLCFAHNKHVLVEKPMALNHRDAKEMVETARCDACIVWCGVVVL